MKNLFMLFLAVVALVFVSCEKEEEILKEEVVVKESSSEKVKIFISSNSAAGLKSATAPIQVQDGDTIEGVINVNSVVYAENTKGEPIKGNWGILSKKNDTPLNFFTPLQGDSWGADQTSVIFPEYGIYEVYFYYQNTKTAFYVKVFGIPGKIGDGPDNNFIFRLEKKNLVVLGGSGSTRRFLFLYYKFENTQWLNHRPEMIVNIYRNSQMTTSMRPMSKWLFSNKNYYYCILDLQNPEDVGDLYEAAFVAASDNGGSGDNNNSRSNWSEDGKIKFQIF